MSNGDRLMDYAREVYGPRLEVGLDFQDYVLERLHSAGIVLQPFGSKRAQQKAENMLGLEIKFDRKLSETGNLYIETHERSHPDRPELVPSGVYRNDRCWLFGIGNYSRFYVFGKRMLQRLISRALSPGKQGSGIRTVGNDTATSKGVLLPETLAREYAERCFEWEEGQ